MNKKYRINEKWQNKQAKKIADENWTICHEIIDLRDGHFCQIPGCEKTEVDLDHGISRSHKAVFFDIRHMGYLCRGEGGHHPAKSFNNNGNLAKQIDLIHIDREGREVWEEMLEVSRKTCGNFRTVMHQEQQNIKLKELKAMYLSEQDEVRRA